MKGPPYYLVAVDRSALFAAALEFKTSSLFPFCFFSPGNKQRTLSLPPPPHPTSSSESVIALQKLSVCPLLLTSRPPIGLDQTRQGVPSSRSQTRARARPLSAVWGGGGDPTRHNKSHAFREVRTHLYAPHGTSLNRSLPLSVSLADTRARTHTHTHADKQIE